MNTEIQIQIKILMRRIAKDFDQLCNILGTEVNYMPDDYKEAQQLEKSINDSLKCIEK